MNPGSLEAIELGCLCPILDNAHGAGSGYVGNDGQPLFWIEEGCPIHGTSGSKKADSALQ
jgi:hypothetical protein